MNINDLQIEKDILPLFDYTFNDFSKEVVQEIFNQPLSSIDEIKQRQILLKGFTYNHPVLKQYNYSASYLIDVYYFLKGNQLNTIEKQVIRYKLLTSTSEKTKNLNKITQLVLLFDKLYSSYFSRLKLDPFPREYQKEIKEIILFFERIKINNYGKRVREGSLKTSQLLDLTKLLLIEKSTGGVDSFWQKLFLFEAYLSINRGILKNNFIFPEPSLGGLEIQDFYYPLIENPVLNTLKTNCNVIVLTGPNMSGKSTLLKALGLCIYLAQIGVAIPASQAIIPFYSEISVSINHKDDLQNGYSHFMTEVMNLKEVVEKASNKTPVFAVFDELFSGTNEEDALEICTTTINGLAKFKNSFFLISTHIQKLKDTIKTLDKRIETHHIECKLTANEPQFTYLLNPGWSNLKIGKILFEQEGLNLMLT